jgi:hypothetical protein
MKRTAASMASEPPSVRYARVNEAGVISASLAARRIAGSLAKSK